MLHPSLFRTDTNVLTLRPEAIVSVYRVENNSTKYVRDYAERPSPYMVLLRGEKRRRRVYATPIGNVSVWYLKVEGHKIYCESAVDEALNRAED